MVAVTRSTKSPDNFSYTEVDDSVTVTIPVFQLMFVANMLYIRGTLCVLGDVYFLE